MAIRTQMKTHNITIRIPENTHIRAKSIAQSLDLPTSQIYKWLIESSMEMINKEKNASLLPKKLQVIKSNL